VNCWGRPGCRIFGDVLDQAQACDRLTFCTFRRSALSTLADYAGGMSKARLRKPIPLLAAQRARLLAMITTKSPTLPNPPILPKSRRSLV
jgi:hypothetical protein